MSLKTTNFQAGIGEERGYRQHPVYKVIHREWLEVEGLIIPIVIT
jgi:hypothetical protein